MQALEALTRDAKALANGEIVLSAPEAEVARQLQICNACRYCEGFCAVFPAMTRRLEFGKADIHFLANLCHNCGACLHACQYAPPHEFAVNVPQAMAQVRGMRMGYAPLLALLEPAALDGAMTVRIITAAQGFGRVWEAVIGDFAQRHPLRDVRVSINDAGATPAVVSLRLDQAVETLLAGDPR